MYVLGRKYGKLNSHFGLITFSTFLISTAGTFLLDLRFGGDPQTLLAVPACIITIAAIPPITYSKYTETYPYNDPQFRRGFEKQRTIEKRKAAIKGFVIGILTDVAIILIANGN